MIHYYSDLVRLVRIRLNRCADFPSVPEGSSTGAYLPLDDLIESVIEESVVETIAAIPPHEYPEPVEMPRKQRWVSDNECVMPLPADFGKLVMFRMSGWIRFVDRLIMPGDPSYPLMFAPQRMFRGTPSMPRCYYVPQKSGGVILAASSDSQDEEVLTALYVPVPRPVGTGRERRITFPESLLDVVVAAIADRLRDCVNMI